MLTSEEKISGSNGRFIIVLNRLEQGGFISGDNYW